MDRDIYIKTNNIWSKNSTPYVTVVTPVYNREKTILCAMKTIERQTFKDIEYIVVDDGSIDNSAETVLDFMKKTSLPMMLIKKKNGGVHTARNIAIKYARGEMYYCNDSDDESLPDAIEKLVNIWKSIPCPVSSELLPDISPCTHSYRSAPCWTHRRTGWLPAPWQALFYLHRWVPETGTNRWAWSDP